MLRLIKSQSFILQFLIILSQLSRGIYSTNGREARGGPILKEQLNLKSKMYIFLLCIPTQKELCICTWMRVKEIVIQSLSTHPNAN